MNHMEHNFNFLMPLKGVATKTFAFEQGEWELKKNYKAGKYFKGFEIPIKTLQQAYEILQTNQDHSVFMIHGAIIDGTDKENMIRRKRSDHQDGLKPTITDRNLSLFCLDIDGYKNPDIEAFITEQLPEPFHSADYIYQYSSSYGLTTKELKCHLFFWLNTPVHNLDIRAWIKGYNKEKGWGNIIDDSVLNCAQPIYIQKRICEGAEDPVKNFLGYVQKMGELFWVPDPSNKVIRNGISSTSDSYDLAAGVEKILTAENYHEELNKLALSLINKKVPALTVKEMLEGAMNAAKRGMSSTEKNDKRWQDRFDDIGRSVDSAVEIVDNPTLEEVLYWIKEENTLTVKANFAQKILNLSPMDRTTAIAQIVIKIGFGVNDVKKTVKIAEEQANKEKAERAKAAKSEERKSKGVFELECTAINGGDVSKAAGTVLAESKKYPQVFKMGGGLASVALGIPKTIRQCTKLAELGKDYPKIPIIKHFMRPYYSLGGRLEKDVIFTNETGTDIECPTRVLHMIGEANNNHFKSLTGIVEHPFIDNKWDLVQKNGYNKITGLYTLLHRKLKVTKMDPKVAYEYISKVVLDEFPFAEELDRVVAIAALLTAIQRPTIAGDTGMPGFGIVSPIQSSGKTTLAQLLSYSVFNRPVAASSWSEDEEELGKHILAILQEGHSCVLFDNIKQGSTIQSGRLAMAMSNDVYGGRQLGENKTIEVPSSVIWIFTGNGIKFVGDFATRIYPITINPDMEDPNTRVFKRDNIGQWAMDNRKKIISALLSIIVNGKGMLEVGGSTRFKLWDQFVRRPLLKVSGIDVNDAVKNNQKDDPLQLSKLDVLTQLQAVFNGDEFTTREVIKSAFGAFESEETELGNALTDALGNKAKNSRTVGKFFSTMVDMVLGGLSLKKRSSNIVRWLIVKKNG